MCVGSTSDGAIIAMTDYLLFAKTTHLPSLVLHGVKSGTCTTIILLYCQKCHRSRRKLLKELFSMNGLTHATGD